MSALAVPSRRTLCAALCALAGLAASACNEDGKQAPRGPRVNALYTRALQDIEPLSGDQARPVLAISGVPIRRGDFESLEPFMRAISPPDIARQPILETLLVNALLPRALVLSRLPQDHLRAITAALQRCRGKNGRYDLARLTAELAPYSSGPLDPGKIEEFVPRWVLRKAPVEAAALASLVKPGQQCGPFFSPFGLFVYELAGPLAAGEGPRGPRCVRLGGLYWDDPGAQDRVRDAINEKHIDILDEQFRIAVPEWHP